MPRFLYWAASAGLLVLQAVFLIGSLSQKSATFDEPSHLVSGLQYVATGDYGTAVDPPPVIKVLAARAVRWSGVPVEFSPHQIGWSPNYLTGSAQIILFRRNDADRLLFWGRMPTVAMSVLLALAVFVWARRCWGDGGGLLALVLAVFCPTLLANGRLITTDVPVALFLFVAVGLLARDARRLSVATPLAGVALGLAMLSKHSGALCIPILLALLAARAFAAEPWSAGVMAFTGLGERADRAGKLALAGLSALLVLSVAWLAVWGFYGFRYRSWSPEDPAAAGKLVAQAEFRTANAMPASAWPRLLDAAESARLLPEPYLLGLRFTLRKMRYRLSYFMGERSIEGSFWYFPVSFLVKTPVGLLMLLGMASGLLWRRKAVIDPSRAVYLLGFPLLYFGATLFSHINIGHRHLMPLYPFLFVIGGAAACLLWDARWTGRLACGAALAWFVAASLWIRPDYLAYFNELAGGPRGGMRILGDSSLDWGEDLRRLRPWMEEHGVRRIKLGYFGTALPEYYGFEYEWLPSVGFLNDQPGTRHIAEGDYLAVSATCLQGFYFDDMKQYDFLRQFEPIDHLGHSIYLFHIRRDRMR